MEKIVYILGAGFSAPLGLPVMSNFRFMSQSMFFEDPASYKYFDEVFDTIRKISVAMGYYKTDVFNIEDILSILEMRDYLEGRRFQEKFKRYIIDVIDHYTPIYSHRSGGMPGNWQDHLLGTADWKFYARFVCNLLNLSFTREANGDYNSWKQVCVGYGPPRSDEYAVITFNYDRVLESVVDFMKASYTVQSQTTLGFASDAQSDRCPLAKLHGSVDREIVPPTWSKGVVTEVVPDWKLAFRVLTEATQIRILGYSLPVSDAYFKYLLKSAVIQDQRLKKIDVICRDSDGSVKKRYDEFINFGFYNFVNGDILQYLVGPQRPHRGYAPNAVIFEDLENDHYEFMRNPR